MAHRYAYELLVGPVAGVILDHRCHNPACVNPEHLRVTDARNKQNGENRGRLNRNNTSGVRGVWWNGKNRKWAAEVTHFRRKFYLGLFAEKEDAERAVISKRNELFTHNDLDRVVT